MSCFSAASNNKKILILGLDASGKSSLLHRMKMKGDSHNNNGLPTLHEYTPTLALQKEVYVHTHTTEKRKTSFTLFDLAWTSINARALLLERDRNSDVTGITAGTDAIIMMIDCAEGDGDSRQRRLRSMHDTSKPSVNGMLREVLNQVSPHCPVLLFLNKQDSPFALTPSLDPASLSIELDLHQYSSHMFGFCPASTLTGEGLTEGFDWLASQLTTSLSTSPPGSGTALVDLSNAVSLRLAVRLRQWQLHQMNNESPSSSSPLSAASDAAFLREIMEKVNHGAGAISMSPPLMIPSEGDKHLIFVRLAWLLLTRFGRREALPMLFHLARTFTPCPTLHSEDPNAHHESLVYFWINIVHFAFKRHEETSNFTSFLYANPHLLDEQYVYAFYSRSLLMTDKAKACVVLPDLQPMPCIVHYDTKRENDKVTDTESDGRDDRQRVRENIQAAMPRIQTLSDGDFYQFARDRRLPCWGHHVKLRLIYCLLKIHGRHRGGVDEVLQAIKAIEQGGFNITVTYFWIQLTTYHAMKVWQDLKQHQPSEAKHQTVFGKLFADTETANGQEKFMLDDTMPFDEFIRYETCEELTDAQLMEKYYPKEVLLNLHDQFVTLPTIKPLPSIVVN